MLAAQQGQKLERIPARGRARLYRRADGKVVRLYCSNDRVLIARAHSAAPDAKLTMEDGADLLLLVMPRTKRTPGPVEAYLVPIDVAAAAVKEAHRRRVPSPHSGGNSNASPTSHSGGDNSNVSATSHSGGDKTNASPTPSTGDSKSAAPTGDGNLARTLWFDADGPPASHDYATHWRAFRLPGSIAVKESAAREAAEQSAAQKHNADHKLGDVIAQARAQIAQAAGVSLDAVKITVDLG